MRDEVQFRFVQRGPGDLRKIGLKQLDLKTRLIQFQLADGFFQRGHESEVLFAGDIEKGRGIIAGQHLFIVVQMGDAV